MNNRKKFLYMIGIALTLAVFVSAFIFVAAADEPTVEYIYFDLAAGDVTITGKTYKGYIYVKSGDTYPKTEVSDTLGENQVYYVYQSEGGPSNPDSYKEDGTMHIAERERIQYDNKAWGEYITNHPQDYSTTGTNNINTSVETVIDAWVAATNGKRTSTANKIIFTGNVGLATNEGKVSMVLDNVWSSAQRSNKNTAGGSIQFNSWGQSWTNNEITLLLKGDNRMANIDYATKANKLDDPAFYNTNNCLIFDDFEPDATLTVANNKEDLDGNYWSSAIGSCDGQDACYGLGFNGGIIYAGTTSMDDCTAIGGGGNGAATITIKGGTVTAVASTSGAAIGGGIGKSSKGGSANITIEDGNIYAYNFGYGYHLNHINNPNYNFTYILAAAIGGGSSANSSGCETAIVSISGGNVYAQSVGGTAIGGGSSTKVNGGNATVNITGGTVEAKSIAGQLYDKTQGKLIDVLAGTAIGGGTGGIGTSAVPTPSGGQCSLTISQDEGKTTVLRTGSIGGGSGKVIGAAHVTISGGTLQGQIIMEGTDAQGNPSSFTMTGGTINNANTEGYTFKESNGGAVCVKSGTATISGGEIIHCGTDSMLGGAIYVTGGNVTISDEGSIHDCTAQSGGAVYVAGGNVTVSGGSIYDCTAESGGAIYVTGDNDVKGQVTVSGGSVHDCNAQNGGAIYMTDGELTLSEDGIVTKNTATSNGGGAYMEGGTLNITGGTLSLNQAINGAGASLGGGTLTVTGGNVTNNTAAEDGGGAYLGGGNFYLKGGTISQNTSVNGAGALVANGTVEISGGTVTGNIAQTNGGGIAITDGNFTMYGGEISHNTATAGDGGGIYVSATENDATILVRSGAITDNTAGKNGGAIGVYGAEGIMFTITIGSNTAHTDETHKIPDSTQNEACPQIENNTSAESGGGIYLAGDYHAEMNIHCLTESGNKVGEGQTPSDFMKVDGGTLNIVTTDSEGNTNCGNVVISSSIHVTGGKVTLSGSGDNPKFTGDVTVDVDTAQGDEFTDARENKVTIQYFENFKDANTNETSGQYVLSDSPASTHTVKAVSIYSEVGYRITGWQLMEYKNGAYVPRETDIPVEYEQYGGIIPGGTTIDLRLDGWNNNTSLIFYAVWEVVGYRVHFDPNTEQYTGTMSDQSFLYTDTTKSLAPNAYIYPGYLFVCWEREDDASQRFTDKQTIETPLTTEDGAVIVLKAVWRVCDHQHENSNDQNSESIESKYIVSQTENSVSRTCPCHGYTETATLTGKTVTYDGSPHEAEFSHTHVSVNNHEGFQWDITVQYSGTTAGIGDEQKENYGPVSVPPTDAGTYTAHFTVTVGSEPFTPSVDIIINKANRPAPSTPEYQTVENGGRMSISIKADTVSDEAFDMGLEYLFSWYEEGDPTANPAIPAGWENSGWKKWDNKTTPPSQELEKIYTKYYVDVRYEETENYNASAIVRGESVIIWTGNVTFHFKTAEGLIQTDVTGNKDVAAASGDATQNGITVTLEPSAGYYIYNISAVISPDVSAEYTIPDIDNLSIAQDSWTVWVHNIINAPENHKVDLTVTFSGAEKIPTVNVSTDKDQIFGTLENKDDVTISNDSAYTVQFDITDYNHYSDPTLRFNQALPAKTTLIMMDRVNSTYCYYTVDGNEELQDGKWNLALSDFRQMGTGTAYTAQTDDLKLRFIVDFSRCNDDNLLPGNTTLTAQLIATPVQPAGVTIYQNGTTASYNFTPVSDLEEKISSIVLHDTAFEFERDNESVLLADSFHYTFADNELGISKWNDRSLVLILEQIPADGKTLPPDARLKVSVNNSHTTYPLTDGKFIAILPSAGTGTITVELLSDMFPTAGEVYTFNARLYASNTKLGCPDELLKEMEDLTFTVSKIPTFNLHAVLSGDLPVCDYGEDGKIRINSSVKFNVTGLDGLDSNYNVRVSLYQKTDGVYTDSTVSQSLTESEQGIISEAQEFSLDALEQAIYATTPHLSLMLRIEILDENNAPVYFVPLYFILINNTYHPGSPTS